MYSHTEEKMKKTISVLDEQLASVRAGRANPKILDKIMVDYYGAPTPINQMANIMVPEARIIAIQPWDASMLKEIEKEIQKSDITEERRKELVKDIKKMAEDSKVAIRSIRRDGMDEFKTKQKNNEITEDDLRDAEDKIQKLTDRYVDEIDKLCEAKEKEVMSV